ncbi:MAG: hypothetical protein K6F87_08620 [Lachnospiraceae bacterium]|nr:hypothetical protein [Lachnospiraceae bacterium]
MNRPAIVVIAYDRPDALARLLASIEAAVYPADAAPVLVISIDKSDSEDVLKVADEFRYTHGDKVIMARSERMGLREHVLSCGDLTDRYENIIVLEDDLYVAPCFYEYAQKALDHTQNDDRIGGVSLYDHLFNVHTRESFCAIDDGYDNYYLQLASSWGQAFTKKQWQGFRTWYEVNKDKDISGPFIPANISGWSDRSWLKYYIAYLIENDMFFLYPRVSMTTNFGDAGTHACKFDTNLQVPVQTSAKRARCDFSTLDESLAVYDPFFESLRICAGEFSSGDLITDLYGYKPVEKMLKACEDDEKRARRPKYVISSQPLPYKVVKSYARQMRPVDANVKFDIKGNDLFLYDTTEDAPMPQKGDDTARLFYEYRGISAERMMKMIKYRIKEKLGRD